MLQALAQFSSNVLIQDAAAKIDFQDWKFAK